MKNTIKCPHCGRDIEISEAFRHEMEEKVKKDTEERIRKELTEKASLEVEDLKRQLSEKDRKVSEFRQNELKLREEKRRLQEKEKEIELSLQRKLDEERKRIEETVLKQAVEEHRLKDLEKEKKINDLQKQLEDALRSAKVGSQQLQGEVLELDLEEDLRKTFPYDEIEPVGKGVQGADVIQKVRNQAGKLAGIIMWETKRAKWTPAWIMKLKEDGRKNDATMTVLVCENLPKDISNFKIVDGVVVTSNIFSISLAAILRRSLMFIAQARLATENKDEKLQFLYEYIQSDAFRNRFEAFADGVKTMEEDLLTERRSMERIWKKRETQIKKVQLNASRMFGELQGVMGNALPDIKTFKLESGED